MRFISTVSVLVIHVAWTASSAFSARTPRSVEARLQASVNNYRVSAADLAHALVRVAGDFRVPMGIEWVRPEVAPKGMDVYWKHGTVREVLAAITRTQPGYQMAVRNGVVHVFPTRLIPDRQNFLRLSVTGFQVRDEVVEEAGKHLREFVKATVSPPKPSPGPEGIGHSQGVEVGDPEFSLALANVRVEDVLDSLALASDARIWIVTFCGSSALTATGFRRTVSIWNDNPVPDAEQPVWDFVRWGQNPPDLPAVARRRQCLSRVL